MQYYERVAKTTGLILLLVSLVGAAIALLIMANTVFFLIFLAILLAIAFTYTSGQIDRRLPLGYRSSLGLVVLVLLGLIVGSGYYFSLAIEQQIQRTSKQMDTSLAELEKWLEKRPYARELVAGIPSVGSVLQEQSSKKNEASADRSVDAERHEDQDGRTGELLEKASLLTGKVWPAVGQIFSTSFGLLTSVAVVFFVGLFLAFDPALYRDGLVGLFPRANQAKALQVMNKLGHVLFRWLCGRLATMLITGLGTGLGLWFLDVPLAGTVGTLTALLTFIPNVGGVLALLLAILMALPQGGNTVLWVIGLYCLLQLIESNVITPLIQQHQTSIPPAMLISFQLLVGMLTGFLGLMVATPLLAAVMVIVDETWHTGSSDVC